MDIFKGNSTTQHPEETDILCDAWQTDKSHTTYGGRIYNSDFDSCHSMTDIASRIISDRKFDQECRNMAENRNRKK